MDRLKKIKKTYSEDQVVAILEEIRGDFKVFGEGLDVVQRGVKNLEVEVGGLKEKVEKIDIRLGSVETRLGSVETRLDGVETKLEKVSATVDLLVEDMDEVKANGVEMKSQLKVMSKKLDNKAEKKFCDNHEKRILKLEKTVLA